MKLNEAIKKAYEKAYNLKSKNTAGYVGYVRIHCGVYNLYVYGNGEVDFDLCGCTVDDLIGDCWEIVQ